MYVRTPSVFFINMWAFEVFVSRGVCMLYTHRTHNKQCHCTWCLEKHRLKWRNYYICKNAFERLEPILVKEKHIVTDKCALANTTMGVISKILETHFLSNLMLGHNLWQAEDPSWQRSNSISATTPILRAAEQYLIKRSSRHLCEYKCATKRYPAWQLSQIQSTARFHTLSLTQGGWGGDGDFNNLPSQLKGKRVSAFHYTWECVFFLQQGRVNSRLQSCWCVWVCVCVHA